MFSTDFYASTQEQMNESQKQMSSLWKDYQMKLLESQKKLMNSWTSTIPTDMTPGNISESFKKTLDFQQELINATLETQQATANLAIEAQKKLWDDYFKMTQKTAENMPAIS
jgi:hypothetical protein